MANEETYGFTADIQKKIFAMMLFDHSAFLSNVGVVKPEFFDNPALRDMMTLLVEFFSKYSRAPSEDEFLEELDVLLSNKKRLPKDEYLDIAVEVLEIGAKGNFEYVHDRAIDFVRYQGVKRAVLDAGTKHLKRRDYEGIMSEIYKAINIGKQEEDMGVDLFGDLNARLEKRHTETDRKLRVISTGFKKIDENLRGGICPQEVAVIVGTAKGGKTTVVANFVKEALNGGHHVVHYLFESNIFATQETYDAMFTDIEKDDLDDRRNEVQQEYEKFFDRPGIGRLIVKHSPASGTVWTIESHLHQLKAKNIDPSLLIIDYLGLMKSAEKKVTYEGSTSGRYVMFGDIVQQIVSLAQRGNYAIWLLHQSKAYVDRILEKGGKIGKGDLADSAQIPRHVDLILSINQSESEKAERPEVMRIYGAAGRAVADNWMVKVHYNKVKARIWEPKTEVK